MKKVLTGILCMLLTSVLTAQDPGDIDLNYGVDGISTPGFPYTNNLKDISIMSDDKLISGGYYTDGDYILLSYKFNTDGSLCLYNGANWFAYQMGYMEEVITSSWVLPDDKILLAGYIFSSGGPMRPFVIRLFPDGNLDPSFGSGGINIVSSISIKTYALGVSHGLSGNYNIYLSGFTAEGDIKPAILKLDQDGSVVTSFGTSGLFTLNRTDALYNDIYLFSFTGGEAIFASGYDLYGTTAFVSKHDIYSGELDNSFNTDGVFEFTPPTGGHIEGHKLVHHSTLSENTIALFGWYNHSDGDMDIFAIRLNCSDGTLDNTFGVGGWSTFRVPESNEILSDAILQSIDGKYYFGGSTNADENYDFMIGRLLNNGFFDPIFGMNGIVISDLYGEYDYLSSLALNADQSRIYAGGDTYHNPEYLGTVACYHTGNMVDIEIPVPQTKLDFNIYPNPAQDIIQIEASYDGSCLLEIIDSQGRNILRQKFNGRNALVNIDNLNAGIYFIKIINDNHNFIIHKKIIKR